VGEAFELPLVAERELIGRVQHPTLGDLPALRSPMRLSQTPTAAPTAAPLLGEHSRAVLRDWLAVDDAEFESLRGDAVVVESRG
ncbi:MAG: CoA transferase, partial [Gammaproteobacteria bacterium]|nr:CoA transferase [Gammaproteobacteria bacterium]